MKLTKSLRTAVDAEIVLVKSTGRRMARQAVLFGMAALFGLFALGYLHVTGYLALEQVGHVAPIWSALIVVGADVLLCLILLILARAGGPDAQAIEARLVRDRALTDLRNSFAIATLSGPAGRLAGRGVIGAVRNLVTRRRRRSKLA